ncbi:hypothetical protein PENSPDRAFT_759831 [Peniophora sp. CONT]|nr:hypothetical protein PENSPDRAFT_759831 [Peniophora sp. CONT]
MAILVCELCNNTQGFYEFGRPLERDAHGRIVREAAWMFDAQTGRCISDGGREPRYRMCFNCNQRGMWVHSTEPPAASNWTPSPAQTARHEAAAVQEAGQDEAPEHVWKVRRGGKTCSCRGRCQLRGGGIGGCGCASSGFACSVACGCGGRGAEGDCLNPYTPPPGADPGNKKCSCTGGCAMSMYIGSSCGCASLGVGCSDACQCQGQCRNGHR